MIAHMTTLDQAALFGLATLPFALSILYSRWKYSVRRRSAKEWKKINTTANEVWNDFMYAKSRSNHPAGREFQKN